MRRKRNYTQEEIARALEVFHQEKSSSHTRQILGYPSKEMLRQWVMAEGNPPKERKAPRRTKDATLEEKLSAIHRCYELEEDISLVAKELGRHETTIRTWYRVYMKEGPTTLMKKSRISTKGKMSSDMDNENFEYMKAKMLELQLENDILKETIEVLKKDPGIDQTALTNKEKTVIVDALRNKYSLSNILDKIQLSRSSYYYNHKCLSAPDKYEYLYELVKTIFHENKERYGSRRIYGELKRLGYTVSEKVVRRIMKKNNLVVKFKKKKKYNSYKGEITPAVENLLERDFHSDCPNEKWLTDITEFALPSGKVYLSPIIDCFDGAIVSWTIGLHPNADLVNTMLDDAVNKLSDGEAPIIHSDRGCHYRWPEWINKVSAAGLSRSMSKKGYSPDNSACEGFFGRLKNEMFYCKDWSNVTRESFISELEEYLNWYNNKRIKKSLGYMSPMEYRHSLGYTL